MTSASPTDAADVLARLDAMRVQEEDGIACYNYFVGDEVDAACRASMIKWFGKIQAALKLHPETASVAVSLLDRYLSSGRGDSAAALQDRYLFQLTAIACFYIAGKLRATKVRLGLDALVSVCRGFYKAPAIEAAEQDVLAALEWRTALPTPMDFVRQYVELLPPTTDRATKKRLREVARRHLKGATADLYFAFCPPSVVGACCLACALAEAEPDALSASDRKDLWLRLAKVTDMLEVMEAQSKLLEEMKKREERKKLAAAKPKKKKSRSSGKEKRKSRSSRRKSETSSKADVSGEKAREAPAGESSEEPAAAAASNEVPGTDETPHESEDKVETTEAPDVEPAVAAGEASPPRAVAADGSKPAYKRRPSRRATDESATCVSQLFD